MQIKEVIEHYMKDRSYRFLGQYRYYRGNQKIRFVEDKLDADKKIHIHWLNGHKKGKIEKVLIMNCWRKQKWDN